jgi:hypothetical protein
MHDKITQKIIITWKIVYSNNYYHIQNQITQVNYKVSDDYWYTFFDAIDID